MRNLVIGASGYVGGPLCRYLEGLGEEVVPFDLKRDAAEDARRSRLPLDGVDRVYFLAWDVGGAKYLYKSEAQFQQLEWNLSLMLNVMPQLQASGVPFLFTSSQLAEEYDTVYGTTKRLGEVWTHLLSGVRVRLWNVYGEYEEPGERSHVVGDFIHQSIRDGEIRMMTTGREVRQFVHVDDACEAMHQALSRGLGGVYDITSFEWVTILELATLISEITGAHVVPGENQGSTPLTPIRGRVPGWWPKVDLCAGLSGMVDQFRRQMQGDAVRG